jgi:predicted nucleic acid-binding Zn ribbon protein
MVKKCPECGGKVEQVISAPAVQFKGSGWYVTDYAKKPASGGSSSKSDSEHKSDSDRKSDSERTSDQKADSDRKSKSEVKSDSGKDSAKKESQPKLGSSAGKGDKK